MGDVIPFARPAEPTETVISYTEAGEHALPGCRLCNGNGALVVNSQMVKGIRWTQYKPCMAPGCTNEKLGGRVRVRMSSW